MHFACGGKLFFIIGRNRHCITEEYTELGVKGPHLLRPRFHGPAQRKSDPADQMLMNGEELVVDALGVNVVEIYGSYMLFSKITYRNYQQIK